MPKRRNVVLSQTPVVSMTTHLIKFVSCTCFDPIHFEYPSSLFHIWTEHYKFFLFEFPVNLGRLH